MLRASLLLFPFFSFILYSIYLYTYPDLIISPTNGIYSLTPFDDQWAEGDSRVVELLQKDSLFYCQYSLGKKYRYPHAGFYLGSTPAFNATLDISAYDDVVVTIDPTATNGMLMTLRLYIDGLSKEDDLTTWYYLEGVIPFRPDTNQFQFRLQDMRPPKWWYMMNKYPENRVYKRNYHKMGPIAIGNHGEATFPENLTKEFSMTIKEIRFTKRIFVSLFPFATLLGIYSLTLLGIYLGRRTFLVSYTPTSLQSGQGDIIDTVISEKYCTASFSLQDIVEETGVSKSNIRNYITTRYNLSFKEHLTNIRMAEAQRLLLETEFQISEIAYAVGYQHGTTFTRIFREHCGMTPTKFRAKNSS